MTSRPIRTVLDTLALAAIRFDARREPRARAREIAGHVRGDRGLEI